MGKIFSLFEDSDSFGDHGLDLSNANVEISDLIQSNIDKKSWDNNVNLSTKSHLLIIKQSSEIQKKVNNFLNDLHNSMSKNYQRVCLWVQVGKAANDLQEVSMLSTCNRREASIKSGTLVMSNTPEAVEKRRDFIKYYSSTPLEDQIDKRNSWKCL
ncbi:hypothetical protein [Candidatus Uabimicrobium sp. HlEnr_7]|uniref:hypothetical protein n=1 Tax=Candidatus Uabimicrobium helgolandensis TaxID=3095367 RepID=UPI00355655B0